MGTPASSRWLLCFAALIVFLGLAFSLFCLAHVLGFVFVRSLSTPWSPNGGFWQPVAVGYMVFVFLLSLVLWSAHRWLALLGLFACIVWLALALLPAV
jgi:hypothetical protein